MGRNRRFWTSVGKRGLAAAVVLGVAGALALPGVALADPGDPLMVEATAGTISTSAVYDSDILVVEPTWQAEDGTPLSPVAEYRWVGAVSGPLGSASETLDPAVDVAKYEEGTVRLVVTYRLDGYQDAEWTSDWVTLSPAPATWFAVAFPTIPGEALIGEEFAILWSAQWSEEGLDTRREWWQVDCADPGTGEGLGLAGTSITVPGDLDEDCLQVREYSSRYGYAEVEAASTPATVRAAGTLTVHAVDAQGEDADGYPLRIEGTDLTTSSIMRDVLTDADGDAQVILPPGAYSITYAGWLSPTSGYQTGFGVLGAAHSTSVAVTVTESGTVVTLPVRRVAGVAGQVVDQDGVPLPGQVDVHLASDSTDYTSIRSEDDATFEILRSTQLTNPAMRLRWWGDATRCAVSGPYLSSWSSNIGSPFTLDHHVASRDLTITFTSSRPTLGSSSDPEQVSYPNTLTAPNPAWNCVDGDTEYSYQWLRDGVEIAGAEEATYATTVDDVGSDISVDILASNATGYDRTYHSLSTEILGGPAPVNTVTPTIVEVGGSGDLQPGDTVTIDVGEWNPADVELESVSWRLFNTFASYELDEIVGTGETLLLDRSMVGPYLVIEATVTVSSPGRADGSALTPRATVSPLPTPTLVSTPTVVGDAEPGGTVTVTGIEWSPTDGVGTEFQWRYSPGCNVVTSTFLTTTETLEIPADYSEPAIVVSFWPSGQGYVYDPPNSGSSLCIEMPDTAPTPTVAPSIAPVRSAPDEDLYLPGDTVALDLGDWPTTMTLESVSWRLTGPYGYSPDEIVGTGETLLLDRTMVPTDGGSNAGVVIEATLTLASPGHTDAVVTTASITVSPLDAPTLLTTPIVDGIPAPGESITVTNVAWSPSEDVEGYFEWYNSTVCGETVDGEAQEGVGPGFDIPLDYPYPFLTVLISGTGQGYAFPEVPYVLCIELLDPAPVPLSVPTILPEREAPDEDLYLPGDVVEFDLGTWDAPVTLESVTWRLFGAYEGTVDETVGTGETLLLDRTMVATDGGLTAGAQIEAILTVSSPDRPDAVVRTAPITVSPLPAPVLVSTPTVAGTAEPGGSVSVTNLTWSPSEGVEGYFEWYNSSVCGSIDEGYAQEGVGPGFDIPIGYGYNAITVLIYGSGQGYAVTDDPDVLCIELPEVSPAPVPTVPPSILPEREAPLEDRYLPWDEIELSLGVWPVAVELESVEWRVVGPYEHSRNEVVGTGETLVLDRSMVPTVDDPVVVQATVTVSSPGAANAVVTTAPITVSPHPTPTLTSTPTIVGTPAPGNTISITGITWSPADGVEADIEWYESGSCGAAADHLGSGATLSIPAGYTSDYLTVTLTPYGAGYVTASSAEAVCIEIVEAPAQPAPTAPPTIDGDPWVGETLTVVPGTWEGSDGTDLTWQASASGGSWVTVGTGETFVVAAEHLGSEIQVIETNRRDGFTDATATSASVTVVEGTQPTPSPLPSISGDARVDEPLDAVSGGWVASTGSTFAWLVGPDLDSLVEMADGADFSPEPEHAGQLLVLRETNTRDHYADAVADSAPVTIGLGDAPISGVPLIVTGSSAVGGTLTAQTGSWPLGAEVTCTWLRDGASTGQTGSSYSVVAADFGAVVTCRVAVVVDGYEPATVVISPGVEIDTPGAAPTATTPPIIVGTVRAGQTLSVTTGTWDAPGLDFVAAWSIDGGAPLVQSTLTLTAAHVGSTVEVTVTASRFGYADGTADAVPVGPVLAAPAAPGGGTGGTGDDGDDGDDDPAPTADDGTETDGTEEDDSDDGEAPGDQGGSASPGETLGDPSGSAGGLPPGAVIALVGGGIVVVGGAGAAGWFFLRPKP